MRKFFVRLLVGAAPVGYSTGAERIDRLWDALKWRCASLPGLDASVSDSGRVTLFRRR